MKNINPRHTLAFIICLAGIAFLIHQRQNHNSNWQPRIQTQPQAVQVAPTVTQIDISKWQTVPFTNMGWVNIPIPAGYAIRTKSDMSPRYRCVFDGVNGIHYEASVSPGQMHVLAPDDGYTNYSYRLDFPGNGTFSWHFIPLSQVGKGE